MIAHDAEVHFFNITADDVQSEKKPKGDKVYYGGAPLLTGGFIDETNYVASGYDKAPLLFKKGDGEKWSYTKSLDEGSDRARAAKIGKDAFGGKVVFFDGL